MGRRELDRFELQQLNTMGSRIKLMRDRNNISVEQLAETLDVTPKVVYNIESDTTFPKIQHLVTLRKLFKTTIDFIILGIKNENK